MKRTLSVVLSLLIGMTAMAQSDRDRFVGAWRLVSLEEQGVDGKPHRCNCTGMFAFTRDGHASVQVMTRGPQAGTPAGPVQYSQDGYEASFGRYKVDERTHTFTFHVEGALVRTLIGSDLKRVYELSGKRLVVTPSSPDEHWRVTWEHY